MGRSRSQIRIEAASRVPWSMSSLVAAGGDSAELLELAEAARSRSWPLFDPGCEEIDYLSDARRPQVWTAGGRIDPTEVRLAIELRQRHTEHSDLSAHRFTIGRPQTRKESAICARARHTDAGHGLGE
jgi:hypothetical protein